MTYAVLHFLQTNSHIISITIRYLANLLVLKNLTTLSVKLRNILDDLIQSDEWIKQEYSIQFGSET